MAGRDRMTSPRRRSAVTALLGLALAVLGGAHGAGAVHMVDADLGVSLTAPSRIVVGQTATYAATVANNGPSQATGVSVTLSLSGADVAVSAVSASIPGAQCTTAASARSVRCLLGTLDISASAQMNVTVDVSSPGTLTATVKSREREYDPQVANSETQATTAVAETEPPVPQPVFDQPFSTRSSFPVAWRADDVGSGIATYDVRLRAASPSGGLGPYRSWLNATREHRAMFTGRAGTTYCFSLRATDGDGNVSNWTDDRCTAVMLPAAELRRTGAWIRSGFDGGLRSRGSGDGLRLAAVAATRVVLVASVGPGYGRIRAAWNGRTLRTINLSARARTKRLFTLATFGTMQHGRLDLTVVSSGGTVAVAGLCLEKV